MKNRIAYALLVIVLSTKLIGLHVLSHSEDDNHLVHCFVCDHNFIQTLTPANTPNLPFFSLKIHEIKVQHKIIKYHCFFVLKKISKNLLVSRPPPPF